MLLAIEDIEDHIFLYASIIVEGENKKSWSGFLNNAYKTLDLTRLICIIPNGFKCDATPLVIVFLHNMACSLVLLMNLIDNILQLCKSKSGADLFWKASTFVSTLKFEEAISILRKRYPIFTSFASSIRPKKM